MSTRSDQYADRDTYLWDDWNVYVYNRTHRVLSGRKIWQRVGKCTGIGNCCFFRNTGTKKWDKSYLRDEEAVRNGTWPEDLALPGCSSCQFLDKDNKCSIWKKYGFKAIPIVCQIEPCVPLEGLDRNCCFHFIDVTTKYL